MSERGWAMDLILAERERQVNEEGYSHRHDDHHAGGELAQAARCYEMAFESDEEPPFPWPWDDDDWKPKDALSNRVRAGALYLAESDRHSRRGAVHRAHHFQHKAERVAERIERLHDRPDDG